MSLELIVFEGIAQERNNIVFPAGFEDFFREEVNGNPSGII